MRTFTAVIACLASIGSGVAATAAPGTKIHSGDNTETIALTWGGGNPEARLEVNTDARFVSEGTGSIVARSVVPADSAATSYVGFRIPVAPLRIGNLALAFEAWSSEPANTRAFYVRGLNAKGKIVVSWSSWSNPLDLGGHTYTLVPGRGSRRLSWEKSRIQAPDDPIVSLEFIVGSLSKGKAYNMHVDNVRLETAPELPPRNFAEHGLVAPVGMPTWGRSTMATVGADGRRVVFTKLWTGSKASYLFIDAETGQTEQVFPDGGGWGAYTVIMTPAGVVYDTMGKHMVAIDVATRTVRQVGAFGSGMALGYTRAEDGTVYAGIYPSATLISYAPAAKRFTNHGPLNREDWPQYLSPLVLDQAGWVYGSIGLKEGQVAACNPPTGQKKTLIPPDKRQRYTPKLYRGTDGQVYAYSPNWGWHRLLAGEATPVADVPGAEAGEDLDAFPDGSRIARVNIPDREIHIQDTRADTPRQVRFDYKSTGVNIYTIAAGADGKVHGATGIPLRVWSFDPATGEMWNSGLGGYGGHINQFDRQGDLFYGAVYSTGALLEYDPRKPFDDRNMAESTNPRRVHYSGKARDLYGRPHAVLAHPDGRHVLVGGHAARVLLGSGMLIYDSQAGTGTILDRTDLIPDHGINAMVALPDGDVLIGTDIRPPTAGTPGPATTAMVYRFDMERRTIASRWAMQPDTPAVRDMVVAADGRVYGLAEPSQLFVFDPAAGEFIHQEDLTIYGAASGYQAPRCMVNGPDGAIYALFRNAVVRIEPSTYKHDAIAWPDATISSGIAIQDGHLYFGCGPSLYSCALKTEK